mmetsp:Transcript_103401/g.287948  ORF Transcript_103401/g.287948 Transcript_103401/m.287948 type:complete len:203 (+) Transcript_103401:204-812(+)
MVLLRSGAPMRKTFVRTPAEASPSVDMVQCDDASATPSGPTRSSNRSLLPLQPLPEEAASAHAASGRTAGAGAGASQAPCTTPAESGRVARWFSAAFVTVTAAAAMVPVAALPQRALSMPASLIVNDTPAPAQPPGTALRRVAELLPLLEAPVLAPEAAVGPHSGLLALRRIIAASRSVLGQAAEGGLKGRAAPLPCAHGCP